jgi:hypothetical protein
MGRGIREREFEELYKLLSVEMMDRDCGSLCAPLNDGIPYCCDRERAVPALYREEYAWQRAEGPFWGRMRCRTEVDRALRESIEAGGYAVAALCPGPSRCDRTRRALVCRTYPLEPHLDEEGRLLGLTFTYAADHPCPLITKSRPRFNPAYLRNALRVWERLLQLYPEERELYIDESRRLRRRFRRRGKRVPLFGAKG